MAIYGALSIIHVFSQPYIIQDDARQHIFWTQRYIDPDLFPGDLIANYFESMAPAGFRAFYHSVASLGFDPVVVGKVLPIILGCVATFYCFQISLQLIPLPAVAFLTCLIFNQGLWMEDDLVSATPRAFLYPIFMAFLNYLLRRNWPAVLVTIVLNGLFYPQMVLSSMAIITFRLFDWPGKAFKFSQLTAKIKTNFKPWLACMVTGITILLIYRAGATEFDPTITVEQAKALPEFNLVNGEFGRAYFFTENPWLFWLIWPRSGLLFIGVFPPLFFAGLGLPFVRRQVKRFPLIQRVNAKKLDILTHIFWASIALFFLSHAVLFKLHLPNRYVYYTFRFILTFASSITIAAMLESGLRSLMHKLPFGLTGRDCLKLGFNLVLAILLVGLPFSQKILLPLQNYQVGEESEVYEFLQQQPKDALVASLSEAADNIPTFSKRSTLVAYEYALPYHWGYAEPFRQRSMDLIQAQYSPDIAQVQNFIQRYGVDFWLVDQTAFQPEYVETLSLVQQMGASVEIAEQLRQDASPALLETIQACSALENSRIVLLDAECILGRD